MTTPLKCPKFNIETFFSSLRFNGTLCSSLVKYLSDNQDGWDACVDPCLLAYKTSVSRSTKQTPFLLAFGKEPTLLVEEDFPVGEQVPGVEDCSDDAEPWMLVWKQQLTVSSITRRRRQPMKQHSRDKKYTTTKPISQLISSANW